MTYRYTGYIWSINADVRNTLVHLVHGVGHGFEGVKTWNVDSSAWIFVPFWNGSWVERIYVIIYVRSKCINALCA